MAHPNEYPRAQFVLGELLPAMTERRRGQETYGSVAQRDLERYYHLLRQSLPAFSEAEASLLVDACNGWLIEPHTARLLWAEVADAISLDGLDRKWDVDGPALVARLRNLTPSEALAACDAIERFWRGDYSDTAAGLARVGLVR